jgi:REP element-mobilizing transposase RayT
MKVSIYLYFHTIFCTSQHLDLIDDANTMEELLHEVLNYYDCELFEVICTPNHVHILHSANQEMCTDELLKKIKLAVQTKYQRHINSNFYWDPGYYVFSVGGNALEAERITILEQPILHKRISLDSELKKYREDLELNEMDDITDLDEHRFN